MENLRLGEHLRKRWGGDFQGVKTMCFHYRGYNPWGRKESDTTERLSTAHFLSTSFLDSLIFVSEVVCVSIRRILWKYSCKSLLNIIIQFNVKENKGRGLLLFFPVKKPILKYFYSIKIRMLTSPQRYQNYTAF